MGVPVTELFEKSNTGDIVGFVKVGDTVHEVKSAEDVKNLVGKIVNKLNIKDMKCPHCQVEVNVDFSEKIHRKIWKYFYSLFYMRCPNSECDKPIVLLGQANNANQYHDVQYL